MSDSENTDEQPESSKFEELLACAGPEWRPKTELEKVHWELGKLSCDQMHRFGELLGNLPEDSISGEAVLKMLRRLVHDGTISPMVAQTVILTLLKRDDPQEAAGDVV